MQWNAVPAALGARVVELVRWPSVERATPMEKTGSLAAVLLERTPLGA
jgi:hypothetical protein